MKMTEKKAQKFAYWMYSQTVREYKGSGLFLQKEVSDHSWFDLESSALVMIFTEESTCGPFGKHLDLLAKLVVQCTGVEIQPSTDRALMTPTIYDCFVYEIDLENNYIPATVVTVYQTVKCHIKLIHNIRMT